MRNDSGDIFIREFVVGLGFLNGLWLSVGINPKMKILTELAEIAKELNPDFRFSLLLVLPLIFQISMLVIAGIFGGLLALLSIFIAFLGGVLITINPLLGGFLLMGSVILGLFVQEKSEPSY